MRFLLNKYKDKDFRSELKYVFQNVDEKFLERNIKKHPALFSEIFHKRWINNIYFDSADLNAYYSSIDGLSPRIKVRVRWYNDFFGFIHPTLEFKMKQANKNVKALYELDPMSIPSRISIFQLKKIILTNPALPREIKNALQSLRPTMINRYERQYYMSQDKAFRVTVDRSVNVASLLNTHTLSTMKKLPAGFTILEMKYKDDYQQAGQIIHEFAAHLQYTRMSKYTVGLEY